MKKIFIIIFFFSKLNAATIYDHEIESFVSDIIELTNLESENNINFSIFLDDTPNAFVTKHNEILITTGLLKYIPSAEGFIGVIAHEIGHLKNYHLSKRNHSIKDLQVLDQMSNVAAITTSILINKPELIIKSAIANKFNIQNYYSSFSKNQEREADIFALERLNYLKISSESLRKFLKFLERESYKKGVVKDSFIFSTHPNYEDRFNLIESFSSNSFNSIDTELNDRFLNVKAKLFGHTENDPKILDKYLIGEPLDYSKAIILAYKGNLFESLKILNKMIDKESNNKYLLETKADILLSHGYIEQAKEFYEISLFKNKNNIYIQKTLFDIDYELLEFNNYNKVSQVFEKYKNLVFHFSKGKNFYQKWFNLFNIIEKNDWLLFVNAKIDISNNEIEKSLLKLNEILNSSKDKILLNNTKKLINEINDK